MTLKGVVYYGIEKETDELCVKRLPCCRLSFADPN